MVAEAKAYKDRSLQGFQDALALHKQQLVEDPIVHAHLSELYDTLLEGNLARLIEPFSCVEISHLAHLIKLPQDLVLGKLSQVARACSKSQPYLPLLEPLHRCIKSLCCIRFTDAAAICSQQDQRLKWCLGLIV